MTVPRSRAIDGYGGEDAMERLAQWRALHEQILRWRNMAAIAGELSHRYPELGPLMADLQSTATVRTDIAVRRELTMGCEAFTRTADFETVPAWIRQRWRRVDDTGLTRAYVRYAVTAAGAAYTGPRIPTEHG